MTETRWWTLAVIVTAIVLSALVLLDGHVTYRVIGAIGANALIVLVWVTLGKRALASPRVGLLVAAAFIALTTIGVCFEPSMATVQCVAYPVIWTVLERFRRAIIANVALAVGVAFGLYVGIGPSLASLAVAATVEGLSLVFSLALGLWITSISVKSAERKLLIDQLESAQEQLTALSRDAGAATERERLAREIHDTIAQDLTGLVLTAQRGLRELRAGNTGAAEKQLGVLEENARNALTETRALVASGAAVGVDGGGLATALRRLAERFERETGIRVTVSAGEATALDRASEVILLRCAQEALANVRKHSTARAATVTLEVRDGQVDLSIIDDGSGFDPTRPSSGFGLTGLRDRLASARGTLAVNASPGGGTRLVATLPVTEVPVVGEPVAEVPA